MNYVVYYLNNSGFPQFTFVCEDSIKEAKKSFLKFHPDAEIKKVFVAVDDVRNWLISAL